MNTEIIAETIKIIGAVGVIASVLYLAIQIRQNTRSERSSTQQQLTDRIHNRLQNLLMLREFKFAIGLPLLSRISKASMLNTN
jgi:hypothetical protein